jgi:hypothetical protein
VILRAAAQNDHPRPFLDVERTPDAGFRGTVGAIEPPRPFRLYSAGEGLDGLPPQGWRIENAIPENGIVALIGAKGSLKTFVALDIACSIATGIHWQGRAVKPGIVVYILAEGQFGAKARIEAWCELNARRSGLPLNRGELSLWLLPTRVAINDPIQRAALIEEIELLAERPALIVIDTLNANLEGAEDDRGMGGFSAGCVALRDRFGATVLVVHHTPLADDGHNRGRGHSSFDGTVDTRLVLSRDSERVVIECTHQRNGTDGWSVAAETVPIAGSLALQPSALNGGQLSGQRRIALEVLHRHGTLTYKKWLVATALKPSSFRKARTWLLANAYVRQDAKKYVVAAAGAKALGDSEHREGTHASCSSAPRVGAP